MSDYVKPKVLVSKCMGFDHCRYNGGIVASEVVDALEDHVEFEPVCPEVGIGLGVPRKPLRLVKKDGEERLLQTETGRDYTEDTLEYADNRFDEIDELDGAILKNRSPSCGTGDVKVYPDLEADSPVGRSAGIFAKALGERYPHKPVENEGRLRNFRIREDFYTALFAIARFSRRVKEEESIAALSEFQAKHKYLLMAYDQEKMRKLGRMASSPEGKEVRELISDYGKILSRALSGTPSPGSHVNVLQHVYGYFSGELDDREKDLFEDYVEDYRAGKVPLSTVTSLIRSWIARFDRDYLEKQRYFDPFPRELVDISDSGKGRDL